MPKSTPAKLKYQKEYNARPEEVNKREARNRARYQAEKAGKVSKGDGQDVDHKKMLASGGSKDLSNTRVVDASTNRAWRKKHPGAYGGK